MNVSLLYLSHLGYGGWVSYTAHLQRAFTEEGHNAAIAKVASRWENKKRDYGYGCEYRNIGPDDLKGLPNSADLVIVTALGKKYYHLLSNIPDGSVLVVHDHTEITPELLEHIPRFKIVGIRPAPVKLMQEKGVDVTYIQHPFCPPKRTDVLYEKLRSGAVSICRLDFDKRTEMLMKANALLPIAKKIKIYGDPGNLWARAMMGKGIAWKEQHFGRFNKDFADVEAILAQAEYSVDLSVIKGDGGGSQYSFLESIYYGAALVVNRVWLEVEGELVENKNCYAVSSPEELAARMHEKPDPRIPERAKLLLDEHKGADVVRKFLKL